MGIKIIRKSKEVPKRKKGERKPTIKQGNVIKILSENVGKMGGITKGEILRKAGYSRSMSESPDRIFDMPPIKAAMDPTISKMREIRTKALTALESKTMTKESAYNLVLITDVLTKNSELLDGKPTSREQFELPETEKARIRKLLGKNS